MFAGAPFASLPEGALLLPITLAADTLNEARIVPIATRAVVVRKTNASRVRPSYNSMRIKNG